MYVHVDFEPNGVRPAGPWVLEPLHLPWPRPDGRPSAGSRPKPSSGMTPVSGDFTVDLAEARVHVDTLQQGRFVFPARLPSTLPAASWSAVNATGFDRLARDVGAVSIAAVKIRLDRATCTPGDTSILSEMSTGIELRWRLLLFLRRPAGLTVLRVG